MTNRWLKYCIVILIVFFLTPPTGIASAKINALMTTRESMQEHNSDDPRRLMHDVLFEEFSKGKTIHIVNPENSSTIVKYRAAPYHISVNLIAFSLGPNTFTRVSISIKLSREKSGQIELASDSAMNVDPKVIDSCLKLHKSEFDRSDYGKAITELTGRAAKSFEEKIAKLNLE